MCSQTSWPQGSAQWSFTLHTYDVLSTVWNVLKVLQPAHVKHMKDPQNSVETSKRPPEGGGAFYRPIRWHKSYYSFTGFKDLSRSCSRPGGWSPLSSCEELNRLKKELSRTLDLSDIRWQRSWGVAHRCSQLQSLSRLSQQDPGALRNLRGHTVMFADQSGLNASGHIMLGTMDVHHQCSSRLPSYHSLLQQSAWLKERISLLLGGTQVVHKERLGPIQPVTEHYSTLNTFHKSLISRRLRLHPRSMQGLSMSLENDRTNPSLHEMGYFIIPATCDPPKLQCSCRATHLRPGSAPNAETSELQAEEAAVVKLCLHNLSLSSLSKEPSVSSSQMIMCCNRLVEQRSPLMQGLHICVSQFYSVMQDGDLCVPWDWKS
ncbi:hypothetical protein KUCAC02_014614 [Chaenocephalus aceratus]|uniref:Uncharacterized protein n=1 Tax=Chaenocephalus aceratus TaxID=36190 RepID=A0ACB9WFW3_CHAAC|nr:hypothetical protein KUCAC02_014614 [Chaenocephalus aceratus]